ncbi:phenylalanine--tRNA ligase subunit alpha [bacterium]|nr:phenylalanine--tRNA ligase subunit alpha [bacterium]
MENLKKQIFEFKTKLKSSLKNIATQDQIEQVRITFLGRKGTIVSLMSAMKALAVEDKRIIGPLLNELKKSSENLLAEKKQELISQQKQEKNLHQKHFDVSAYKPHHLESSLHIYTRVIERIETIFISMGYDIADGPEAETDFYNFQAMNIPKNHPARDMQDTFWLNVPDMLMRTHTSGIQVRQMQKKGVPLAVVAPGRVYRHEATDASHDFMFTQCEGLLVDKNISMSNLLATAKTFLQELFEKKDINIRVRPGYFPFVEPGIEIDFSCPFCSDGCSVCKKTKWIELMGAGLVHPHVLQASGIDSKTYSGFAFGFGIERVAMIKYGINDIRLFHSSAINVLKQF